MMVITIPTLLKSLLVKSYNDQCSKWKKKWQKCCSNVLGIDQPNLTSSEIWYLGFLLVEL